MNPPRSTRWCRAAVPLPAMGTAPVHAQPSDTLDVLFIGDRYVNDNSLADPIESMSAAWGGSGTPWETPGVVASDRPAALVDLGASTAGHLQRVAWAMVCERAAAS